MPATEYDSNRGSARSRGYSTAWDKASKRYKAAHPLCLGCEAVGRVTATAVTDHIVPHKGNHDLMWSEDNWQPACAFHHDVVKQQLEVRYSEGRASKADLRLDSTMAIDLTRQQGSSVGVDGWLRN